MTQRHKDFKIRDRHCLFTILSAAEPVPVHRSQSTREPRWVHDPELNVVQGVHSPQSTVHSPQSTAHRSLAKSGLTLMELLISIVLIGVVMMGVLSFSLIIKRMQDHSDKATVVVTRLSAAFARLSTVAFQAFGTPDNPGFIKGEHVNAQKEIKWVAVRHDVDHDAEDPDDDDDWIFFFIRNNALSECDQIGDKDPKFNQGKCNENKATILVPNVRTVTAFDAPNNAGINVDLQIIFGEGDPDPISNPSYRLNGFFSSSSISTN